MMSAQGYTTEEIADRLFRSVDTMKYHRKNATECILCQKCKKACPVKALK